MPRNDSRALNCKLEYILYILSQDPAMTGESIRAVLMWARLVYRTFPLNLELPSLNSKDMNLSEMYSQNFH